MIINLKGPCDLGKKDFEVFDESVKPSMSENVNLHIGLDLVHGFGAQRELYGACSHRHTPSIFLGVTALCQCYPTV